MKSLSNVINKSFLFLLLGFGLAIMDCARPKPETMPIFRLSEPSVNASMVQRLAETTLDISGEVNRSEDEDRLFIRSGAKVVEVNLKSGAVWAADEEQLWNPELKPALPDSVKAQSIGKDFFERNKLLPSSDSLQPISVSFANMGATYAAFFNSATGQRTNQQLDIQVNYTAKITIPGKDKSLTLPVVGGGGEFNLVLGNEGAVIGYNGLWRAIEGVEIESRVIPQEKANEQFRQMVKEMKILSFESFLAYYSAPSVVEQKFLYPVYVYRAVAQIGDENVPLRLITLPATEYGPKFKEPPQLQPRSEKDMPTRRSTMPEGNEERGAALENAPENRALAQANWREAGASWIGLSGGLTGSQKNAKGFVDGLSADGWNINFNWGDKNAWESDWRRNDDSWVDAADFVFYTGHASMNGWVLNNPDDTFLHWNEVGSSPSSPGDLWGQQDLEWFIVAACGPLQDKILSPGGGSVFERWDGSFDGLHQLLGYGAITFDNEEEGKTVVKYAREGKTIINAWFRTAKEIQPSTNGASAPDGPKIWVGVMYVYKSGTTSPANDHIWLHGSVAPDPTSPNIYVAMWSTT